MFSRKALWRFACGFAFLGAMYAFQRPFHQFPGVEYSNFETPPDWAQNGEWTFARLMFPPGPLDGYRGPGNCIWSQEFYETDPAKDYKRGFAIQTVSPLPITWA